MVRTRILGLLALPVVLIGCGSPRLSPNLSLIQADTTVLSQTSDEDIYLNLAAIAKARREQPTGEIRIPEAFALEAIRRGFLSEAGLRKIESGDDLSVYLFLSTYKSTIEADMRERREVVQRQEEDRISFETNRRLAKERAEESRALQERVDKAHLEAYGKAYSYLLPLEVGSTFSVPPDILRRWASRQVVETGRTSGTIVYDFDEHGIVYYVDRETNVITLVQR